ncbi:MAG: hypothetical protein M4579_002048 [Chaenotheca gracillima]|nr:MAG: hypothetical protein M4579_002048 [Chaenotheca gracillima]
MRPVALSVSTGSEPASPPRTPTQVSNLPRAAGHHHHGSGMSRAPQSRASPRETFLDDVTPVDSHGRVGDNAAAADPRDSHDLSMSLRQVTRDSLVDNMLLSLDQFSPDFGRPSAGLEKPGQDIPYSAYTDDDPASAASSGPGRFTLPKMGRRRGHTHSASRSSDHDYYADDTTPRQSHQLPRGRRSNSSSHFQTGPDKTESHRGADKTSQATSATDRRGAAHARGYKSKGSKGSGSSSVDLGKGAGGSRWTHLTRKRSTSFDQSYADRPTIDTRPPVSPDDLTIHDQQQNLMYDDFDAAPTPTVPVGPRRHDNSSKSHSAFPPQPTYAPPQAPRPGFAMDNASVSSLYSRKERPANLGTSVVNKNWGAERSSADHRGGDMHNPPTFTEAPAPAPVVNDRKSSSQSTDPVKERPGFFRRVFGSSKNLSGNAGRTIPPQIPPMDLPASRGVSRREMEAVPSHGKEQPRARSQASKKPPPEPAGSPPPPPPPPPTLNKKPSSFFRRRKKSVSEPAVPPVAPLHLQTPKREDRTEALNSPVSSLRKVMNPYLQSPAGAPDKYIDMSDRLQHPRNAVNDADLEATPRASKKATIQPVKSGVAEGSYHPTATRASADETLQNDRPYQGAGLAGNASSRHLPLEKGTVPEVPYRESSRKAHRKDRSDTTPMRAEVEIQNFSRNSLERPVTNSATQNRSRETTSERQRPETNDIGAGKEQEQDPTPTGKPRKTKRVAAQTPTKKSKVEREALQEWVKTTPSKVDKPPGSSSNENPPKSPRVWLEPTSSEEDVADESKLSLPLHGPRSSARESNSSTSDYKSASSLPTVQVEDENSKRKSWSTDKPVEATPVSENDVTEEDRERAKRIYDGSEEAITKLKAAPWLGDNLPIHHRTRTAYMGLFDWSNVSILTAMRDLCSKLVLKGETQQVDRILDAASTRWCECNPNHGFKATDVVHTICYSILLLNTDLHLADIDQKMTRSQFIKNTIPTIRRVAADAAPDAFEAKRASTLPPRGPIPWMEPRSPVRTPTDFGADSEKHKASLELDRPAHRHSRRPSQLEDRAPTPLELESTDDCGPLVKVQFQGTSRAWEVQIDAVLKNFYHSIRQQRLPLHGAAQDSMPEPQASTNSLQVLANGVLRRSPSNVSKAPSDNASYRGRPDTNRLTASRWSSKTRSRPRLQSSSNLDSGRTSLDDQSSLWSPSVSSTWSKYSFGKTQTSMSVDSLGSSYPHADYQQSIGFANALSQAIIREDSSVSVTMDERTAPLLEDESLGLAGAPWAKEGIMTHKHHLEPFGKKARDRNWSECFAVIEKGWMKLFSFASKGSMRQRSKAKQSSGGVVGGGNWSENAEALGSFLLRQTIASALPPPGYSKTRPHVWALSLPTGAVHLFQAGTPEIVREFVTTANYWSARLSKEPLVGGVSNVEYGWGEAVINNALLGIENNPPASARPSLQSSIRSSIDHGNNSVRPKLPGDKLTISDWAPPQQSMMASQLLEVDQLKALLTYVKNIETELQKHNELRGPMSLAFSPRHPNATKAMSNWERKSSYLLREIVKFRTYIDSLTAAQTHKEKIYKEREEKEGAELEAEKMPEAEATAGDAAPIEV